MVMMRSNFAALLVSVFVVGVSLASSCVHATNFIDADADGKSIGFAVISFHHGSPLVGSSILSLDKSSPGPLCNSCLEISRKIEKVLTDPELPKDITKLYNDVCHLLPPDVQAKCVETLETYADQALSFLEELFSEQNLCHSTRLCPSVAHALPISSSGRGEELSITEISGIQIELQMRTTALQRFISEISDNRSCAACHAVMKELNDDLENPEMKMKAMRILFKACEQAENHINQCKRMVVEYGPIVISNLQKYLASTDPCRLLRICEAAPTSKTLLNNVNFLPLVKLPTQQSTQPLRSSE